LAGDVRLSKRARAAIDDADSEIHVSAATAWEIATKTRLGKLPDAVALTTDIATAIASQGFRELPVTVTHAQMAGSLQGKLQDPFDRMLIAQALLEGMALVTIEGENFAPFAIKRLW
jgi:PIN domain nuclease of toxin-antitoxin system